MEIQDTRLHAKSTNLDPQELRFALFFWDQLVWPSSRAIYFASDPDERFLEDAGILTRPSYTFNGDMAQGMAMTQISAFRDYDQREPEKWALAQGENSFLLKYGDLEEGKGGLIELHRAVPIPDKDVPLNEILEFKQKRHDVLQLLRTEIDTFFTVLEAADDKSVALNKCLGKIDAACADAIRVGKEWQFPIRLSNLKTSFELRPFVTLESGMAAFAAGQTFGLPATTSLLAGLGGAAAATAPALKLSGDFGWRGLRPTQGPYRYVSRYHSELF
jgi:Family of unknown function (DUF6236)